MLPPFVGPEILDDAPGGLVVADVRWYLDGRSGRAAYDRGHIPHAVFVDLNEALAGTPSRAEGRHPLPTPETFAAAMGAAGIGPATPVVAYDDAGGVIAARLVYLLRILGSPAAVLDGGIAAFAGALETAEAVVTEANFPARPWPESAFATIEQVVGPDAVVLDARDGERYRGETEPVDPRAGHVPGARSLPCRDNLDADGRLLAPSALRARLAAVGIDAPDTAVISYCGSGVTACHNLLVLEHVGLGRGRLFPGSWSQYAWRDDLPLATGPEPGAPVRS